MRMPNSKNIFHHFLQEKDKERDLHGVLFCTSRSGHDPDKLMPTQIIAGKALECMERLVHSYRKQWNIVEFCDCPEGKKSVETTESNGSVNNGSNGICKVSWLSLSLSELNQLH